ncbi:hypothetical protein BHM03_00020758 [Ensete ventricosum]|nr:hypothetical protein BHM03_00020758 [Ensete ventricosum]
MLSHFKTSGEWCALHVGGLKSIPSAMFTGNCGILNTDSSSTNSLASFPSPCKATVSLASTLALLAFLQNFREKEKRIVEDTRSTFNQQFAVL